MSPTSERSIYHSSLAIAGFHPSLHLNLAEDYRKLGDIARARRHIASTQQHLPALNDDQYGHHVRAAVERSAAAITAGSAAD